MTRSRTEKLWHDDHIRRNQVYRDAFPGVEFIGHAAMRDYLPNQGAVNRKQFLEGAPQFLEVIKASLEKNKSLTVFSNYVAFPAVGAAFREASAR